MVTYYGQAAMYRAQQQMSAPNGHFQGGAAMPAWYAGYHHQGAQLPAAPTSYCMQDDQQMWHPHGAHAHNLFPHDFQEFMHAGMPAVQQQPQPQIATDPANQLPSPTITVSGSDPSSPGCQSGTLSPPQNPQARPPPARSPYEWIKKTSYQSQPIPGKTRTKDKYRVVYTDHQRIELEKEFTFNNKYITIRRKSELAANLGLSERQIKIWFQNRRAKERKQSKKRAEERTQADMVNNTAFVQNVMSHPQVQQQHIDMHNQTQTVLSNIVPPTSAVLQRYMESNHPMKLENPESDQLG